MTTPQYCTNWKNTSAPDFDGCNGCPGCAATGNHGSQSPKRYNHWQGRTIREKDSGFCYIVFDIANDAIHVSSLMTGTRRQIRFSEAGRFELVTV